ncbi:MAG TPA: FAD-dependent oxidoreductase [Acetobacteraceae bacterium]|nr:FAD-dependent oxidoreductase [Acetobacteraceae bacterium]
MRSEPPKFSRRFLLQALTSLAATAALPGLGLRRANAAMPDLAPNFGGGRSVAVVGAGVAGLTAGWVLARHGFKVTIYEADNRYGGRSLSPRPIRTEYRDWWFSKYDPDRRFPQMYVSEYQEDPARSPDPVPQICRFDDPDWDPHSGKPPVELFLNAGPGRIPSDHANLIEICRQTGVALEPYIFQSSYNLLQSETFNNGKPISFHQVNYSLRGQVAELLADAIRDGHMLGSSSKAYRDKMLRMLQHFGDLNANYRYVATPRLGFSHSPGGWRDAGVVNPAVPLEQTLDSRFAGAGDPETAPGAALFNSDNLFWQASLLQPVGGMDRIWQQLLLQEIPSGAVELRSDDPRVARLTARDGAGKGVHRYVGDLVLLNHRATGIHDQPIDRKIRVDYAWTDQATKRTGNAATVADFCLSTMAPNLLAAIPTSLPPWFVQALAKVIQTPAAKVGWQGRTRFWETEDNIYGGISWTTDIISQIWYPSDDFGADTGVLTGAYIRGADATKFGNLDQKNRLLTALRGGTRLHPGFAQKVYADKGLTIAWHHMPHQVGGWANETAETQPDIYRTITTLPQGRLYLAGDAWSYMPGWQEGAVTSVYAAINALAEQRAGAPQAVH